MLPFTVVALDLNQAGLAREAYRLQCRAHALEAEWLDYPSLPWLWASPEAVPASPLEVTGAFEGEHLRGLLAVSREQGRVHIERIVVDPDVHQRGWGLRLLNELLAREARVTVETAEANAAAIALYHKAGFILEKRWQGADGLALWRLVCERGDDRDGPTLTLGADGRIEQARFVPSPNCNDYPPGPPPGLLVVHNISLPPFRYGGDAVERLFTNTLDPSADPYFADIHALRVSAHFFIRRDGELVQFVPVHRRAWHAGVSRWHGREGCNDFSLGVELEGCDFEPFCHAQYRTLIALVGALERRGPLELTGHSDIAPGRKTDPGPCFDWARLRRGLAG